MPIYLILVRLYRDFISANHTTLIIANVLVGGIVALFVTGQLVSVSAAIRHVAVLGVAMLKGIVLESFVNQLGRHGVNENVTVQNGAALCL